MLDYVRERTTGHMNSEYLHFTLRIIGPSNGRVWSCMTQGVQVLKMTPLLRVQWYPMILRIYHFIVSNLCPSSHVRLSPAAPGCQVGILFRNFPGANREDIQIHSPKWCVFLLVKQKGYYLGVIFFSVNSHLQTCLLFGCLGQLVVFWGFDGRSLEGFDCDV